MNNRLAEHDMIALLERLRKRARGLGAYTPEAEDLAQEAVLRLMQHMDNKHVATPEHYAMTILHNLARAQWRSRHQTQSLEHHDEIRVPAVAESRLAIATLRQEITALPCDQSQIMELVLKGETSPSDIAKRLDLPIGTVMSRLARARAKLRSQLGLGANTPVAELL